MKLTLKIRLLPTNEQAICLLKTIKEANNACNAISNIAWENNSFQQFKLHNLSYNIVKGGAKLSSQIIVRCISKVADTYKTDKKIRRIFRPLGSISYDSRILSYKQNNCVSIWAIGGRLKIPFICHNQDYIQYIKGESDLIYRKGKFYLFQTVDIIERATKDVKEFIGCDFGLTDILVTSDGIKFSSKWLNDYREKRQKIRGSLQRKGTKGAKKLLKRLAGREKRTTTLINHTISKKIVSIANTQGNGIALEDLKNIRFTSSNRGKKHRSKMGNWCFSQLRQMIEYKSKLSGVPVIVVNPAYTSKTCHKCKHVGDRNKKIFKCTNCNEIFDADENAAKNISLLGASVNCAEKSDIWSCALCVQA